VKINDRPHPGLLPQEKENRFLSPSQSKRWIGRMGFRKSEDAQLQFPLLARTIQLTSVWNEQITPIYGQERGIYAASAPNHPVTSKNSIGNGFSTVKRHKCRAPSVSHLNRSGLGRGSG
jgi:hypothetical protein